MSSPSQALEKGEYRPAASGDLRSPCPALNSLANHGLIPRDGRNITADQLKDALQHIGVGVDIRHTLVKRAFTVHDETSHIGLRNPGQVNESGIPVLDLDQTGRPHAVEHDVSLSREDRALGDCIKPDPDLVDSLVQYPGNKESFAISDLGRFRKRRHAEQKAKNSELDFDSSKHKVACGEAALLQSIFGKGVFYNLPTKYVKAMFQEERLPYKEGWRPRWIPVMFPELLILQLVISHYASPT
jgi:peroxiredoxin